VISQHIINGVHHPDATMQAEALKRYRELVPDKPLPPLNPQTVFELSEVRKEHEAASFAFNTYQSIVRNNGRSDQLLAKRRDDFQKAFEGRQKVGTRQENTLRRLQTGIVPPSKNLRKP
jgi:hypothetical protein